MPPLTSPGLGPALTDVLAVATPTLAQAYNPETSAGAACDTSCGSVPAVLASSYRADGMGPAVGGWTTHHGSQSTSLGSRSTGPDPVRPDLSVTHPQDHGYARSADDTCVGAAAGWQATPRLRLGAAIRGTSSTLVLDPRARPPRRCPWSAGPTST